MNNFSDLNNSRSRIVCVHLTTNRYDNNAVKYNKQ